MGDAVAVGGLLGLDQGVIEHADHFYGRGQLQPSGDVTDVGDHASADDSYFVRGHILYTSHSSSCCNAYKDVYPPDQSGGMRQGRGS